MGKISILATAGILCMACTSQNKLGTGSEHSPMILVGGDVDKDGCKGSAGYSYSLAKRKCIRIWEDGSRFDPYVSGDGTPVSETPAFVVLSEDQSKAEIFFGGTDRPILLDKKPIIQGDIAPILYDNVREQVSIHFMKNAKWILYKGKVRYVSYEEVVSVLNTL